MEATLFYKTPCRLGEGPVWDERNRQLYWVDIEQNTLHQINTESKEHRHWTFDHRIGAVVPDEKEQLIVAMEGYVARFNPVSGEFKKLLKIPEGEDNRSNDGKCDPMGRLWLGTLHMKEEKGKANLYCIYPDLRLERKVAHTTISNGLAWTKDKKTMYFIDTPTSCVQQFDYDNTTGNIHFVKNAIEIPPSLGFPDGMTIDENDHLWIALYGGSGVNCWDPQTGEIIEEIKLPVPNATSCTFGGTDLQTLFITTAWDKLSDSERKQYPLSGSVFSVKTDVKGYLPVAFKG